MFAVQICRTFAQTGCCRYGKRCRFIHPEACTDGFFLHHMPPQTDITYAAYPSQDAQRLNVTGCHFPQAIFQEQESYTSPQAAHPLQFDVPSMYREQAANAANTYNASHNDISISSSAGSIDNADLYSALANTPGIRATQNGDVGLLGNGYNCTGTDCSCLGSSSSSSSSSSRCASGTQAQKACWIMLQSKAVTTTLQATTQLR